MLVTMCKMRVMDSPGVKGKRINKASCLEDHMTDLRSQCAVPFLYSIFNKMIIF
jgi:hypothetical protein